MTERSIKNMFKIADANGSGKLNRKEFARVIKSMGLRPRDNQVEEMLNMLNPSSSTTSPNCIIRAFQNERL